MFNEYDKKNVESDEPCEGKRSTTKAVLVEFSDGSEHWVPKSQIHEDSDVYDEDTSGTLIVSRWWAEQADLL